MRHLIAVLLIALPFVLFAQTDTIRQQHDVITIYFDKTRIDKYSLTFKDLCKQLQTICKAQLIRLDSNGAKNELTIFLKTGDKEIKKVENYKVDKINGVPVFLKDIAVIGYQSGKEE